MYAVVQTGGKQYKVAKDDLVRVEKLGGKAGDTVSLGDVVALSDGKSLKIGSAIGNASVQAEIVEQFRDDKVIIFKKKRRQNYRRKNGHRQSLTLLKITDIGGTAKAAPKKDEAPKAAAPKVEAKKPAAKPAAKKAAPKAEAKKPAAKKDDK